jgi:ADP-heptose:LPS heptosyltransferase
MANNEPLNILAFRFSALGDVAMTVPVLSSFIKEYPNAKITFVSKGFTKPLFANLPGISFFEIEDNGRHKGLLGILRLFLELKRLHKWDGVADLHNVLRTKILRFLFWLNRTPVAFIEKGRKDKKKLTRKNNKVLRQLKHSIIRYQDVFADLGFDFKLDFKSIFLEKPLLDNQVTSKVGEKNCVWIGIAPFAKHRGKSYPLERVKQAISSLLEIKEYKIILFGGRGQEQEILEEIAQYNSKIINVAGKLKLDQELRLIANLNVMISMDSANMHLASLVNTPVVSVWGATHPYAGFYGWNQPYSNALQVELGCRPCSVYGNKHCFRHDHACLYTLDHKDLVSKVKDVVELS